GSGYTITVAEGAPSIVAPVYFLQPEVRVTTAPITVQVWICEQGPNGPVNCRTPSASQIDPMPYLVGSDGAQYPASSAQVTRNTWTWTLPAGTWTFGQSGWQGDFYVNGTQYPSGSAYSFSSNGIDPVQLNVEDVYFLIT
ncbi:MAG: hypothetical protein M3Y37_00375, partial [Chloroflexota bacterium]|nr:hypothetical protein [Chloroflexota bacterium]